MKIVASILKKLGAHRGAPRLWLEGNAPARAGFLPGARFRLEKRPERGAIVLRIAADGDRVVSKKERGARERPVIDVNSNEALELFAGMESVRVILARSEIWILPLAVEVKKTERLRRLSAELAEGRVTTAAVAHGMGVLTNAMHAGLKGAGLRPELKWAIEMEEDALDQAMSTNEAWSDDTIAVAMPLQQVALADDFIASRLPPVSILEAGLPCTAASTAGRAKKHLGQAEDDGKAGHLVAAFVALLGRINPAVMLLENVVPYFNTASAAILRTQLAELGYVVHEKALNGGDYAIEARPRKVMVAVTEGIEIDFEAMVAPPRAVQSLGDILEDVALDDPCWSEMSYLREKEQRDVAAGKGFRMAIAGADATSVGTLGTGYGKNRSTESKVQHPTDPRLLRLLTPREHARVKGIPEHMIAGVESKTRAHELLGQSVIWPAFRHLGEFLGSRLRQYVPVAHLHPTAAAA